MPPLAEWACRSSGICRKRDDQSRLVKKSNFEGSPQAVSPFLFPLLLRFSAYLAFLAFPAFLAFLLFLPLYVASITVSIVVLSPFCTRVRLDPGEQLRQPAHDSHLSQCKDQAQCPCLQGQALHLKQA